MEWLKMNRTCPICRVDMNRRSPNSSRHSTPDHHQSSTEASHGSMYS